MKYIVEGYAITNRLRYLDGRTINDIMGGGGFYAFTAVKMCTDDCLFVASVGKDIDEFYGKWFADNKASKDGFYYQLEKTIYNELKYFKDGSYIEYSIYGDKYSDEQLEEMRKSGLVFLGETDPNELINLIPEGLNEAQENALNKMKAAMLDWYQETCDTVPRDMDNRFSEEKQFSFVYPICKPEAEAEMREYIHKHHPGFAELFKTVFELNQKYS